MKKALSFATEQTKIKKLTVMTVYLTVALIVLVSIGLIITLAVSSDNDTNDGGSGTASSDVSKISISYDDTKTGSLLVVNKNSDAYDFTLNPEASLVSMNSSLPTDAATPIYSLRYTDMKASKEALTALNNMIKAFYEQAADKEAARKLTIWTAYRSYDAQNSLGTSTKGGQSDFHTGMLFEISYNSTATSIYGVDTFEWIYENAYKYGFIERYPEAKSSKTGVSNFDNAFRYVGVAHATYIHENGLCLEEYVEMLEGYTETAPLKIEVGNTIYNVFYVKANTDADTVVTASLRNSTISGDNNGGVIITVKIL